MRWVTLMHVFPIVYKLGSMDMRSKESGGAALLLSLQMAPLCLPTWECAR